MQNSQLTQKTTLSFYRYVTLADPQQMMAELRAIWEPMGVQGRIYLAQEGINAQVSLPTERLDEFCTQVRTVFPEIPFKIALEENAPAFAKLKIKVRKKLVADGLDDASFDASQVGNHLDAEAFHEAMAQEQTLVVDMRNHYECEVGHFKGAILPEANTFREALPEVLDRLRGQEERKILLYCTGGIRCEKASAWLRYKGFRDVNQLHGGIIDYAHQIQERKLPSQFIGKNFVFDQRMGERVTDEVIASCHQCGARCDDHTNCQFEACNRLFIQCAACREDFFACCSRNCQTLAQKAKEQRVKVQHQWAESMGPNHYLSRTRVPKDFQLLDLAGDSL
ncbi:MAG: rhodanese-related sulfurtransferase [Proteobacteria bacterium]|nr:rhodanese-related sulfurtransferase [Pseudomonadota bacterium]